MTKPLIAGLTALALSLTPAAPVAAQNFDQETVGKLLFGLVAALAVGKIIQNQSEKDTVQTAAVQPIPAPITPPRTIRHPSQAQPVHDRGGLRQHPIEAPAVTAPRQRHGFLPKTPWHLGSVTLPADCTRNVRNALGQQRLLMRSCINDRSEVSVSLPPVCYSEFSLDGRLRGGYSVACLREAGYRIR